MGISQIRCHHRLILTGTPIQNNLKELWALFDFVVRHAFPSPTLPMRVVCVTDLFAALSGLWESLGTMARLQLSHCAPHRQSAVHERQRQYLARLSHRA